MKVAIICGGPSLERGISLNSARSVMDHLESENIEIIPIYLNQQRAPYLISKANLYSNTPSDFDFKLARTAKPLSEKKFIKTLKATNLAFPVMHGPFGEDGGIQKFFEKNNIPFVGSGANSCQKAFDKYIANEYIKDSGFFTLPSAVLKIYKNDHKKIINNFFKKHKVKRAIVKPATGGSSIGVFSVSNPQDALERARFLFSRRMDSRVVIEIFAQGTEFTIIILENRLGVPVALIPTEIETDYTKNQIFNFRRKYLPTRQVSWHCPPRLDDKIIKKIQDQAEQLFSLFAMRDFARFDGWVLPNGQIWFCDFNPISGMEQNSFLFQQGAMIGMTHSDIMRHIIKRASQRFGIDFPKEKNAIKDNKKIVNIIMGGDTSEKQVSLMSGTNVWLKLRQSKNYDPRPYLLDHQGSLWRVPYHLCLNHTVEEISANCKKYPEIKNKLKHFQERARLRLGLAGKENKDDFFDPEKISLKKLTSKSNFIFIALHGGDGENGTLQKIFSEKGITFNGPDEKASALCLDKWLTSRTIDSLNIKGLSSLPGKTIKTKEIIQLSQSKIKLLWQEIKKELKAKTLIVKPRSDGCSTGIIHLFSSPDLMKYCQFLTEGVSSVPKGTFRGQLDEVEMPDRLPDDLLFERFFETDSLRVKSNKLKHLHRTGWLEVTIGILENDGLRAFNPSITIVEGEVLSVEEKFQGGTGINLTPPPEEIINSRALKRIKKIAVVLAIKMGINGYSRIDAFANIKTGDLKIIEINTLPGLTPSTVLYQQALTENPPIFPKELLEIIIRNKGY